MAISRVESCPVCSGSGSRPGTQPRQCPTCNGTGQVRRTSQTLFGRFVNTTVCHQCHGEGRTIDEPCPECRGSGRKKQQRTMPVKVPAGVDSGTQMCLSGEGDAGTRGGPPGNLYITFSVREHKLFTREGDDIHYELAINFAQAALGAEFEVPTIEGKTNLKVPAGSQTEG